MINFLKIASLVFNPGFFLKSPKTAVDEEDVMNNYL